MIRRCSVSRCKNEATYRGRCPQHARARERTTERAGYHVYRSKRWRIARRRALFTDPLCSCGEIATEVHHRQAIEDGGDPYDQGNLETLCKGCHSVETRREQIGRAKRSVTPSSTLTASGDTVPR